MNIYPISPCKTASGMIHKTIQKKMEETVHGSYSWCRLTKREKN